MREKAEKRALEERISVLQSQIVTGGGASVLKDSPAFRNAVKEHQERVRQEYEARLHDLEKVRTRAFDFASGHPAIGPCWFDEFILVASPCLPVVLSHWLIVAGTGEH